MREFFDKFFFLKNGYAFLAHVFPFGIASLLLLTLSVPQDNLLLKLVTALARPAVWLPATLLAIVSTSVYVISVYVQIRKAYLFECGNKVRTAGTCLLFMFFCTLMAYVVLRSASTRPVTAIGICACFIVAVLSLTGIGWSTPTTWIQALGVKHPDYEEAQRVAHLLTDAFASIRGKSRATGDDVTTVLSYAGNLLKELEKNIDCEPIWARQRPSEAKNALHDFVAEITSTFANAEQEVIEDFAQVMNCKREFQYNSVVGALRTLAGSWHQWQCS